MRQPAASLLTALVILGLLLADVVVASPFSSGTSTRAAAASVDLGARDADFAWASKRPKAQRQDPHDEPQDLDRHSRGDGQRGRRLPTGVLRSADGVASATVGPPSAEDRYIVLLADGTSNAMRATTHIAAAAPGVIPTHVYRNVFEGFAAVIPDDQLATVQNDSRVQAVVPDAVGSIDRQTLPRGITRIDANRNATAKIDGIDERVNVDVAVLDSAGDDVHPDLNIHTWANCTDNQLVNSDDDGHGTHVGGIIGALDNDRGIVGVAPGARLWNIKVMQHGSYLNSWVICALDLVTLHAADIEVVNASFGGAGTDSNCQRDLTDQLHQAFCRTVAAGVTVVVSAGNGTTNAANQVPATYDEVITVSALADSDGRPRGLGPATRAGPDDSLASFSNFGADVDIAAPGVDILSTVPTGSCAQCHPSGYGLSDGTSMAAPHVTGAAALLLADHPGASPAQVKTALLTAREQIALVNDPDGIHEGVLQVGTTPVPPPPPPPPPLPDPGPAPATVGPPPVDDGGPNPPKSKKKKGKKGKKGKGKGKNGKKR